MAYDLRAIDNYLAQLFLRDIWRIGAHFNPTDHKAFAASTNSFVARSSRLISRIRGISDQTNASETKVSAGHYVTPESLVSIELKSRRTGPERCVRWGPATGFFHEFRTSVTHLWNGRPSARTLDPSYTGSGANLPGDI